MKKALAESLRAELTARGFTVDGHAPFDSIILDDDFLSTYELTELLELMVVKREKAHGSVPTFGRQGAREMYEDASAAIAAIRAIIDPLVNRSE